MPTQPHLKYLTPEKFLNTILEEAVRDRASDVHIEPLVDELRVRFRIDGYLQERYHRPLMEIEPLVTRIKAISDLDLATRLPQDGHFEFSVELSESAKNNTQEATQPVVEMREPPSRLADAFSSLFSTGKQEDELEQIVSSQPDKKDVTEIKGTQKTRPAGVYVLNVRVSVFPTVYGEAVVFRLLNRSDMLISLSGLGMEASDLAAMRDLITRTYGMVLTTGPSGSGKTTTLYAILQELKNKEKNIITLEDPVEFYFGDIRQTQIRPEQGLTYAVGMRSVLRQDPDVIMIGEIRDRETAEHAMRASLVGRMVGSTVHSNTAVGTIARLIDMNVERSLIAFALNGIIDQRLVRKVCDVCAASYAPDPAALRRIGIADGMKGTFRKGSGCAECGSTGFNGRTGVFGILVMDDELQSLIVERSPMRALQEYMEKSDMATLRQRIAEKVLAGVITAEEAARAV
ncbi:MAG: type IV pilus assembly protein PilB [Parcubacteria group bacterium Gr01-1014_29]|nr:MAG: type IV pilus assembly protein PilB [Parcubacteria group bacterium Gr01-1014_29]